MSYTYYTLLTTDFELDVLTMVKITIFHNDLGW